MAKTLMATVLLLWPKVAILLAMLLSAGLMFQLKSSSLHLHLSCYITKAPQSEIMIVILFKKFI